MNMGRQDRRGINSLNQPVCIGHFQNQLVAFRHFLCRSTSITRSNDLPHVVRHVDLVSPKQRRREQVQPLKIDIAQSAVVRLVLHGPPRD